METIYYSVDTKQITCQAGEDRKASGGAEGVRCVVVPRARAERPEGGGTVVDFEQYRRAAAAGPEDSEEPEDEREEPEKKDRRALLGLALDVCATAAIIAVTVLVAIRFWML